MLMQIVWVTNKEYYGMLWYFLEWSIEKITTFIRSRGSLENHTRFQTKMGKVYTYVQTKKVQKPYALERHILV